ncbi:MAG: hypothetical protein JO134_20150 [Xanthobacteraceae bacterium]|nr:hypothetical protein [Xanthobacteraceae bacterium]MBV9631458.1 hypothetical protein [Xanthobacteraceae bacterium]
MKKTLLASVVAVAFVAVSGASWAQVGGNAIPKYSAVTSPSTNKKVVSHGVGGNSMPSYPKAEHLTKNSKVVSHGVGGNSMPSYPKSGTH